MKVSESLSIIFFVEKTEASKDGRAPIYTRITLAGRRCEISLGMRVFPEQWDKINSRVKGRNADVLLLNNQITQARANLEKAYFLLTTQYEYVTADMLKKSYQGKPVETSLEEDRDQRKTFMQTVSFEIGRLKEKVEKGLRAKSTLQRWEITKNKFEAFLLHKYKKTDIPLEMIKPSFAEDMLHYFMVSDELDHNTSMKYVKNAKQVLTTATGRWIKSNPIRDFHCTYHQPEREVLTMQEILAIYDKSLINRLDQVRDVFLFSCFTGLAYQEVYNLTENEIVIGNDRNKWIKINRVKTGNPEDVPLLPIPEAIIEKYKNDKYCKAFNKLLPVNSNVRYNAYLKELADLCGIRKTLTTHIARHTFATTVTLENDVPMETVSRMLGHKNIRTTQIYAKITKKKISNDMNALRKKLFSDRNIENGMSGNNFLRVV
jgi:site-specific recombinase XerD